MYGNEIQKASPTHIGRLKARSPKPMGRSPRWADTSFSESVFDRGLVESVTTSSDFRGYDLPDDDQADFDSGDGAYDIGCD